MTPVRVLVVAATALALTGCSSPSDDPSFGQSTFAAPTPAPNLPSSTPSLQPTAAPSGEGNTGLLIAAGATALELVDGTTLVSIETERSGTSPWKVELVTTDGDEQELTVAPDASEVTRTGKVQRQDAGDRRDNLARTSAATLTYADAIAALPSLVAGGTVSQLDLDTEGAQTVWEAEVADPGGVRHQVQIDAQNGTVVKDTTS